MSLWLVRAGRHGQHEPRFFNDNRIYLTWDRLTDDLSGVRDNEGVRKLLLRAHPDDPPGRITAWTGQVGAFLLKMKSGDLVAVPRKGKAAFAVGEIQGAYSFDGKSEMPYRHSRAVKWLNLDVPRSVFDQDLLFSLGAIQTICQISRERAEERVRSYAKGAVASPTASLPKSPEVDADVTEEKIDLERLARDQIARTIIRRFKGHDMARLVEAILKAQGYTTFTSPPGPDKGIDILAAPGPLGFGRPRICVQVKSQDSPIDTPTLNQLIGSMQNVGADQGLLVAWGGFKSSVDKEAPAQFFRVRLWDQDDLIEQLLEQYEKLSEDLRAELPLKRVWTVAAQEEEE